MRQCPALSRAPRCWAILFSIPLLYLGTGCGEEAAESSLAGLPRLSLVQELRIGSVDDPDQAFTWFRELEVAPDGRIYTMHPQEETIRVHDQQGRLLRTIGRRGEGPGEFQNLGRMGMLGDTLWVLDFGTYRFSYFSLEGELLGSRQIPIDLGSGPDERPPRPRGLLSDGSIMASPPAFSRLVVDGTIKRQVVLRMDVTGAVADTLFTYSLENTTLEVHDPDSPRGPRSYVTQPFTDTEIAQISPSAPAVIRVDRTAARSSDPTAFRVTRVEFGGDTVFSREYEYTPIPLTDHLVDSIIRDIGQRLSKLPFPGRATQARVEALARDALYRPAFHPPVSGLVIGRDGTLWLQREKTGADFVDWIVLAPTGEAVGIVAMPRDLRVLAAERGTVWGMESDELDVPYIVRYRVVESD